MKREDIYYEAMRARDPRFDGKFFVGVKTTGIYCRPICPAKPKRENVEFFHSAIESEKAGYRPCLRCRPESAPLSPAWIGKSAVVRRAIKALHSRETIELDEERFADQFGVTARHLRRLFIEEIGKTPKQLSFENRLGLARKLIVETPLPMTEIAYASGFSSIRRFNDSFKERFKKSPREIRRGKLVTDGPLRVSLPYRPPFDFDGLLKFYESHRVGDLERFENGKMHRLVRIGEKTGWVALSHDPVKCAISVEIDFPDTTAIQAILSRVRALFDLDSDPLVIANSLETDASVASILREYPGIRLPSGWDPFEIAIGAILGQLVTVSHGRKLVADLIEIAGEDSGLFAEGRELRHFPTALEVSRADLAPLGTTRARKQTLADFARAVHEGAISLEPTQDVDRFMAGLRKIRGIGPWTAQVIALKALRHTDAFPAGDLILARALERHPLSAVEEMSPWRGYAAALFWRKYK